MNKRLFDMDAFEFVINYQKFLEEIEGVIKPELLPVLQILKDADPHDLVTPDIWFVSETQAMGYVWSLFLQKCREK